MMINTQKTVSKSSTKILRGKKVLQFLQFSFDVARCLFNKNEDFAKSDLAIFILASLPKCATQHMSLNTTGKHLYCFLFSRNHLVIKSISIKVV